MKNIFKMGFVILIIAALSSCGNKAKNKIESSEEQTVAKAGESSNIYVVDTEKSRLKWEAYKLASKHYGTVDIKSGELSVEQGELKAGKFIIDMPTITVLDLKDEKNNAKLTNHLKDTDFFHVDSFPTSRFEISDVEALNEQDEEGYTHKITGNLTILDKTRSISFPAKLELNDDAVTAYAIFTINRLDWGIKYNSTQFFKDLADDYIVKDDFQVEVELVAYSK